MVMLVIMMVLMMMVLTMKTAVNFKSAGLP